MSTESTLRDVWQSLWPLRIVWLVLPFVVGPAVADAMEARAPAVGATASSLAWLGWAVVLVATLIPRTISLTVVRLVAPGVLPLAGWSAVVAEDVTVGIVAVGAGIVAVAMALLGPGVADDFVDGSSYGDERRVALRTPVALLAAPVPLAWVAAAAGAVTGPLLLAAERWIIGAILTAIGVAVVVLVARRLHVFSRRWLVFVPAGVVVHDPLHLAEPILFPTRSLQRFGPVAEVGDAVDATGGATGLVLELRPSEPISLGRRTGRSIEEVTGVSALLVSPIRPGATLILARDRKLPVNR